MQSPTQPDAILPNPPRSGPWGHILVAASACALTVSIVGSAVFLTHRAWSRYELQGKIRDFLISIENRTPDELQQRLDQLGDRPKLVEQMLPELMETLRNPRSEEQLVAVLHIIKPFMKHTRVINALVQARSDRRERIAAAAVDAIAKIDPPTRAADLLGQCLDDATGGTVGPAAVDRACAGLFDLGRDGMDVARTRIGKLSVDRRVWIVKYVNEVGGPYRSAWLDMMAADADERVKLAVAAARAPAPTATAKQG